MAVDYQARLAAIDRGEIMPRNEGERIGYHIRRYHALMALLKFIGGIKTWQLR